MMVFHKEIVTLILAESHHRWSKKGMACGNFNGHENQKMPKCAFHYSWRFVLFVNSFSSYRNRAGEITNAHMRIDARTWLQQQEERFIYLNKRKPSKSFLCSKEAHLGSLHDFAHNPTQNCLADCLMMSSAGGGRCDQCREDRKMVRCGHSPWFRTFMEHKAFLTWGAEYLEKEVFFLNIQNIHKIPLEPPPQKEFRVMFVGVRHTQEHHEFKTKVSMLRKWRLLSQTHATNFLGQCRFFSENIVSMGVSH